MYERRCDLLGSAGATMLVLIAVAGIQPTILRLIVSMAARWTLNVSVGFERKREGSRPFIV